MKKQRTQREIKKVYDNIHNDYKSNSGGIMKIMYFGAQGTTLSPIDEIPEKQYQDLKRQLGI